MKDDWFSDIPTWFSAIATTVLAIVAFCQMGMLRRQQDITNKRAYADRASEVALKDVYLTKGKDPELHFQSIANLGSFPIVLRFAFLHDKDGSRIAEGYTPLISLVSGQSSEIRVPIRPSIDRELYSVASARAVAPGDLDKFAAYVCLVYQAGRNPDHDFHVIMPRYRNRPNGEPAFSQANKVDYKVPRGKGLGKEYFTRIPLSDPRDSVEPFTHDT